jgi:hypothetical protein
MKRPETAAKTHEPKHRFAYVLYATNVWYGAASLVTLRCLKALTAREDVDFLVLHTGLPRFLLETMEETGAQPVEVSRLRYTSGRYFRDCLVKLRIFQLTQFDRVVYLDVDTLPLKNLDPLFSFPFSEPLAAPPAYWLTQPQVTTLLMVVKPSPEHWGRIKRHFQSAARNGHYDGEIINLEFQDQIHLLPDTYACLNSEWEDRDGSLHFGDPATAIRGIPLVHFTALGKPWYFHPVSARRLRPNAHPIFHSLWQAWWSQRNEIIHAAPRRTRWKHRILCYGGRRELHTLIGRFSKSSGPP